MSTVVDGARAELRARAPLAIAAVILLVVLVALPWHGHPLPSVPEFSGIWLTLLLVCDLLSVLLLLGFYRSGASPRLIALSWAYLWSAGVVMQIAASEPGVLLADSGFATDPNSAQWLWASRHVVPPLLIAVALAPWPARLEQRFAASRGRSIRAALSCVLVGLGLLATTVLIARAPDLLPTIVDPADPARLKPWVEAPKIVLNLLAVILSVWGVTSRGSSHGVESWAVVASVAFLGEVWLSMTYEPADTVAFYVSRILGIAASAFVMLALLRSADKLHADTSDIAHHLEEQNAQLLEAQRLRDHLTAVVSHDLRTPLAGLQGYLELLRDDDLDSALARRMLERSWMLTRRLTLLTEDLLAATTLENGDLVVTPQPIDLGQQLAECAACFPDLDLELDCAAGLAAYADPLRLQQILANLVRNAQKHGAEPARIAALPDPHEPGGVLIRVSDAGEGVPEAFVPRLFERYTQGTTSATGGSGLGLSVVRDLVTAHGGTIAYEAESNTFLVSLPGAPLPAPASVVPAPAPSLLASAADLA